MKYILFIQLLTLSHYILAQEVLLPINATNRASIKELSLTNIGAFGLSRKARPKVKRHLHTGIDIKRPDNNYINNPIFPIAPGVVISKRDDGPFAQLIVEHKTSKITFWSVYEHIAGINVELNEEVDPSKPIARFMNRQELERYGRQFDHFHLELLKVAPILLKITADLPDRRFNSYTLLCHNQKDLFTYFYHPIEFFEKHLTRSN